jgi:glycosyltransferase involved in cell wall biosynthesis
MRIALLSENYPPATGGVAQITGGLAEELSKDHEVLVVTYKNPQVKVCKNIEVCELDGEVVRIYPQFRYNVFPQYKKVNEILKKFGPDVVHVQNPMSIGTAGEWFAKENHVPVVSTFHTDLEGVLSEVISKGRFNANPLAKKVFFSLPGRKFLMGLLKKSVFPSLYSFYDSVDALTSPSRAVTELLMKKGIDRKKIHEIPDFIESGKPHIPPRKFRRKWDLGRDFTVLHVGRICWEKRIDKIIETAQRVPDAKFVVTSEGPQKKELEKMAAEKKLDNVIFTGYLPYSELYGAYSACNVFLAPSPHETFNVSAAQALSFGKPIIGVNRMGLRDFIIDKRNGFLVEPDGNEVNNYEARINELKSNYILRGRMGVASRLVSRRFGRKKVAGQFVDLYEETVPTEKKWKSGLAMSLIFAAMKLFRI